MSLDKSIGIILYRYGRYDTAGNSSAPKGTRVLF